MNILKEEKPLIEWEKEMDVWVMDLLPMDHYNMYNKMDAFSKMSISSVKRGWGDIENRLYKIFKTQNVYNDNLLFCDNLIVGNNEEKSLIEWEKELGFCIAFVPIENHLKKYNYMDAIKIIKSAFFVRSWNTDADKLYDECYNNSNSLRNDYIVNMQSFDDIDLKLSIKDNGKSHKDKKCRVISKRNPINKKKVKKSILKVGISIVLSIAACLSSFGFAKANVKKDNINTKTSYENSITSADIFQSLSLSNNGNDKKVLDNIQTDNTCMLNANVSDVNSYPNNDVEDIDIINMFPFVDLKLDFNKDDVKSFENSDLQDISLGDIVTIKDGSNVYGNIYNAIDRVDGLDAYYSCDIDRFVDYIALDYNNEIIYSNSVDEINYYKDNGADVVSVCTSINGNDLEGFYNSDDVIVKVKKM